MHNANKDESDIAAGAFPGHLGLKSMRERTARMNGTFEVRSQPGKGTHILVCVPRPAY